MNFSPKAKMNDQNLYEELFSEQNYLKKPDKHGLYRSANNSVVAGVCAGIANYLHQDVKLIRLTTILLLILGWWVAVFYLVLAFMLPIEKNPKELSYEEHYQIEQENARTVFAGLLILFGIHFSLIELGIETSNNFFVLPNNFMIPVIAIAFSIFLFTNKFYSNYNLSEQKKSFRLIKKRKMFLGVCSGLSKYLSVDLTSLRIIFLILLFLTLGLFSIFYFMLYLFTKYEMEII